MDLKQRKRIINSIPRFNTGNDGNNGVDMGKIRASVPSQQSYGNIDQKVGINNTNDVSQMIGQNAPISQSSPSFTIGQKSASQWNNSGADLAEATRNLPSLTGYFPSIPTYQQISNMKIPGIQGSQMQKPDYVSMGTSIAGGIGDLFSQSGKFGDKTSSAIRNYGGAAASMVPGKHGQLAQAAVTLLADTIGMSKYKHTADEMRNNAGMSNSTINGINYTTQNALDTKSMYSDVKDTAIKNTISNGLKGSVAGFAVGGPIGAVVGGVLGNVLGIFGGRKAMIRQKRINRNAQMQNLMLNQGQMAYADTEALQNKYYQNNYDTTGQLLYANNGKDIVGRKRLMNITKV